MSEKMFYAVMVVVFTINTIFQLHEFIINPISSMGVFNLMFGILGGWNIAMFYSYYVKERHIIEIMEKE